MGRWVRYLPALESRGGTLGTRKAGPCTAKGGGLHGGEQDAAGLFLRAWCRQQSTWKQKKQGQILYNDSPVSFLPFLFFSFIFVSNSKTVQELVE